MLQWNANTKTKKDYMKDMIQNGFPQNITNVWIVKSY